MAIDGDDLISLPTPPPPRAAARREAIDAALRKFDGIEDPPVPRRRPSLAGWASTHRGLTGGLVTAALIAVISIPAIQVATRKHPPAATSESSLSERAPAEENTAGLVTANEPPPAQTQDAVVAADEAPSPAKAKPAEEGENAIAERKVALPPSALAAPSPMAVIAAPAPPSPPPPPAPPAQPQAEAADSVGNIIVTGSRIPSANEKSSGFAQRAEAPPSPREIIAPYGDFLNRLQEAIGDNDRRAVLRLVGLPLRANFSDGPRIYRTRQEVERDYDRIFTPAVRQAALNMGSYDIVGRDGGRLRGGGRIWFGCGNSTCSSEETIRVREVTP